jgi:hypothetical protein
VAERLRVKSSVVAEIETAASTLMNVAVTNRRGLFGLQIRPTDTQDSGRYFCLVNGERRPWRLYAVAVQDVPSTPGKPLIMAFNSTAVNLSWTPPLQYHHAAVTHYLIQAPVYSAFSYLSFFI